MPTLTLIRDDRPLDTFQLGAEPLWIGSGAGCDIRLDGSGVAARLASISRRDDRYILACASPEGVLQVNGSLAPRHVLRDADVIHLGEYRLQFNQPGRDGGRPRTVAARRSGACLEVLDGRSRGRVIRLESAVTRLGRAGTIEVMISRRRDGYYLSHLEGRVYPRVNRREIGEEPFRLYDGDTIQLDVNVFEFRNRPVAARGDLAGCMPAALPQRHSTRIVLDVPATLGSGPAAHATRLIDLSLSGALVARPGGWTGNRGERSTLTLRPEHQPALALPVAISQLTEARIGMAFVDLAAQTSEELRWLVKASLADNALLEREFSEPF